MSDTNNGAGPPPSLRDIAEQAYTDLETEAEAEGPGPEAEAVAEEPVASDDRPRDKSGRWVSKSPEAQPGEAIRQPPADPAPKPTKFPSPVLPFLIQPRKREAIRLPSIGAQKTKRPSPSCPRKDRPSF